MTSVGVRANTRFLLSEGSEARAAYTHPTRLYSRRRLSNEPTCVTLSITGLFHILYPSLSMGTRKHSSHSSARLMSGSTGPSSALRKKGGSRLSPGLEPHTYAPPRTNYLSDP